MNITQITRKKKLQVTNKFGECVQ